MQPVLFKEANVVFNPPEGYDPETSEVKIAPLVAYKADGWLTTAWKPTFDELQILNNGGAVMMMIHGETHPVVSLSAIPMDYSEVPQVEDAKA